MPKYWHKSGVIIAPKLLSSIKSRKRSSKKTYITQSVQKGNNSFVISLYSERLAEFRRDFFGKNMSKKVTLFLNHRN